MSQIIVGEGLAPPVLKMLPFGECVREQIGKSIWQYIDENQVKWEDDSLYPFGVK